MAATITKSIPASSFHQGLNLNFSPNLNVSGRCHVVTTLSGTFIDQTWSVDYATASATDIIAIWGLIDVIPSAGSLDCVEAQLLAFSLQQ